MFMYNVAGEYEGWNTMLVFKYVFFWVSSLTFSVLGKGS